MKIGGQEVPKDPNYELVPLLRAGQTFMLKLQTVTDFSERDTMLPEPKPSKVLKPGGKETVNLHDPEYLRARNEHTGKMFNWVVLKALAPSEIEWETVDMGDPNTWENWEKELKANGCTDADLGRIIQSVFNVQGLDQDKIDKARDDFLALKGEAEQNQ